MGNGMLTLKHVDIEMPGGCLSGNVYPRGKNIPLLCLRKKLQMCCILTFSTLREAEAPSDRQQSWLCWVAMKTPSFSMCAMMWKWLRSTDV